MTPNDGGPAFPFTPTDNSGQIGPAYEGMSLRDWFAGMTLQGLLSCEHCFAKMTDDAVARNAYDAADAMLSARNGKEEQ